MSLQSSQFKESFSTISKVYCSMPRNKSSNYGSIFLVQLHNKMATGCMFFFSPVHEKLSHLFLPFKNYQKNIKKDLNTNQKYWNTHFFIIRSNKQNNFWLKHRLFFGPRSTCVIVDTRSHTCKPHDYIPRYDIITMINQKRLPLVTMAKSAIDDCLSRIVCSRHQIACRNKIMHSFP